MTNLVAVLVLVGCMVWVVSPNYVKLYKDKIVRFAATTTPQARSSIECAVACKLNYPCVSYAYHPGKAKCYLYDRVIHPKDSTGVDKGIQTYTSKFGNNNIALHKRTAQSSTHNGVVSSRGVDGDKTNLFQTKIKAWWCVDLMAVHKMKWLILYNVIRTSTHKQRIKGFEIWLAASGGCTRTGFTTSRLCYRDMSNTAQNIYTFSNCSEPNTQFDARYVFINNPTNYLHLYEVEIVPWCCQA